MAFLKTHWIMKTIIVLCVLLTGAATYVAVATKDSKHMTTRQRILKAFYPLIMKSGKKKSATNAGNVKPLTDLYAYTILLNDSSQLPLSSCKGKKIVLVNTASDCGFTAQYEDLQKLHDQYGNNIVVIGFPANDFQHQEKGTDASIASFCKKNYGVDFPLATKGGVIKNDQQQEVYKWLTNKGLNGWNDQPPTWNFCKYIVNEEGVLTHFFESGVPPLGKEMKKALNIE